MSFASNVAKNNGCGRLSVFGRAPRRVICPALPITCSRDTVEVEIAKRTGSVVAFNQADTSSVPTDSLRLSPPTTHSASGSFSCDLSPLRFDVRLPRHTTSLSPDSSQHFANLCTLAFNVDTTSYSRDGYQLACKYFRGLPSSPQISLTTSMASLDSPAKPNRHSTSQERRRKCARPTRPPALRNCARRSVESRHRPCRQEWRTASGPHRGDDHRC